MRGRYQDHMLEVKLLNTEDVRGFLQNTGLFARASYDTKIDSKEDAERVAIHCLKSGHLSTTRSLSFVFNISGISRTCSHQLVRHSQGVAINQRSQRYVKENEPTFVIPDSVSDLAVADRLFNNLMKACWSTYADLLELGIPADDARFVLPNACTTEMNISFTYEALVHFFHERLCSRASWEIRYVAEYMLRLVLEIEPRLKPYLVPKCVYLNGCKEAKPCGYFLKHSTGKIASN